jgi:hypothetical protein
MSFPSIPRRTGKNTNMGFLKIETKLSLMPLKKIKNKMLTTF